MPAGRGALLTVFKRTAYGLTGVVCLVLGLALATTAVMIGLAIGDAPERFDRRTVAVVAEIVQTGGGGPHGGRTEVQVSYEADGRRITTRLPGASGQGLSAGDRVEVFYRSDEPGRVSTEADEGPLGLGTGIAVIAAVVVMSVLPFTACWGLFAVAAGKRTSFLSV